MKPFTCYTRFFLLSLCSAWMIGTGTRLLVDGFFGNNLFYVPFFDAVFDWGIMIILGSILFVFTIYITLKEQRKEKERRIEPV